MDGGGTRLFVGEGQGWGRARGGVGGEGWNWGFASCMLKVLIVVTASCWRFAMWGVQDEGQTVHLMQLPFPQGLF
jgi:hypothetical protein